MEVELAEFNDIVRNIVEKPDRGTIMICRYKRIKKTGIFVHGGCMIFILDEIFGPASYDAGDGSASFKTDMHIEDVIIHLHQIDRMCYA